MELNAVTRSVNDIFSLNKKYLVPRFQREYSWSNEEVEEFWDDISSKITIVNGVAKNEEYFIGCIVLVGEDAKFEYQIVDGQQRLTTLTILIRAIVDRLQNIGEPTAATALHSNVIEGVDNDGNKYFKLVNETPKPYFQNEVQAATPEGLSTATTEEEQLLLAAYNLFKKRIGSFTAAQLSPKESIRLLRDQVLNYLKFILVTAKSEDDAYTIFETLNARGLGLSSVDLIKNWIFKNHTSTHPNDNAKEIWAQIRTELSPFVDINTFFRHYWNSKYSFASDDRLYKSFRDFVKNGQIATALDFLKELKFASVLYRKIGAPRDSDWPVQKEKAIFKSLALINQYKVTQVRPFLLALLECHNKKKINQTDLIKAIVSLERFHFLFSTICQDRASGLEGKYTRAAKNLHLAATKQEAKLVLKGLLEYLETKRPKESRVEESISKLVFNKTFDGDKKTIQTIFYKLESHLGKTNELIANSFSLEHIDDQSNESDWHSGLGNLLPLAEEINNTIGKNKTFKQKKLSYKKSSFKTVDGFLKLNPQDEWTEAHSSAWLHFISSELYKATALMSI